MKIMRALIPISTVSIAIALSGCSKSVEGKYVYKNGAETTTIELKSDGTCTSVTEAPLGKFGAKGNFELAGSTLVIEWAAKTLGDPSDPRKSVKTKAWTVEPNAIVSSESGHRYVKQAASAAAVTDKKSGNETPRFGVEIAQLLIDEWASSALRFEPEALKGRLGKGQSYQVTPGQTVRVTSVTEPQILAKDQTIIEARITFAGVPIERRYLAAQRRETPGSASGRDPVRAALRDSVPGDEIVVIYSGNGIATFRFSGERWFLDNVAAGQSSLGRFDVLAEWSGGGFGWQNAVQERRLTTPYPPR